MKTKIFEYLKRNLLDIKLIQNAKKTNNLAKYRLIYCQKCNKNICLTKNKK